MERARSEQVSAAAAAARPSLGLTAVAAWLVPGAGHALQGQFGKALVFFLVLVGMFAIGIGFGGRLFAWQLSDILVGLAAVAEWLIGLPRIIGAFAGIGQGQVTA